MPEMSAIWTRVAAVLYSLGLFHAILTVLRSRRRLFRPALGLFAVGAVIHMVAIVEEMVGLGSFPLNNFYQSASVCAFLIAVVFLLVYWRYRIETLGVFLFPLVFLLTFLSTLRTPVGAWSNPTLRDAWLVVHVALILLGYSALLVMAASSVIYLVQERHLKHKGPMVLSDKLPELATLDELISWSMAIAFVLITLAVIAGSAWAFVESGTKWIKQPRIVVSLLTWGFYLAMVFLRVEAGWRGRKAAYMAIVVVGASAVTWAAHTGLRGLFTK
jgi:ABC-type uncharacterized transport system permease subunit